MKINECYVQVLEKIQVSYQKFAENLQPRVTVYKMYKALRVDQRHHLWIVSELLPSFSCILI